MRDRDFLAWVHDRLVYQNGDNELADFMHKLRCIIAATPADQETPNNGAGRNSLEELMAFLKADLSNPVLRRELARRLLGKANLRWEDAEFGAPAIDPKRPYGDSDGCEAIRRALKMPNLSDDDCWRIHKETLNVLKEKIRA